MRSIAECRKPPASSQKNARWAEEDQAAYDQQAAQQQAPPPPAPAADDQAAQLQNLAELHSQGVLTDDEFAAAKAKLLGI